MHLPLTSDQPRLIVTIDQKEKTGAAQKREEGTYVTPVPTKPTTYLLSPALCG